jgi:hypothetical protein
MLGLASVELERGNVREAQDLLKRAVDEHPEDAESLAVYAKFMENQARKPFSKKPFFSPSDVWVVHKSDPGWTATWIPTQNPTP